MSMDVVMPQMGESVAEGTITKWLKQVGDQVKRDEPLFEISTDKVDAEIPSPEAGQLLEILHGEGETVEVNTVVARIGAHGEQPADGGGGSAAAGGRAATAGAAAGVAAPPLTGAAAAVAVAPPSPGATREELRRRRSSPLVRRIAAEHGVDLALVAGTGVSGRVTKQDILGYVAGQGGRRAAAPRAAGVATAAPGAPVAAAPSPVFAQGEEVHREPMSIMRQRIAEHMISSRRTSAHVTTVFEVDMTAVGALRRRHRDRFQAANGVNLSITSFIARAAIDALRAFPMANASLDGDDILYHRHINLGIAVALDWGLIVPVIRHAEGMSLAGVARAIADLAGRARAKQLSPDDVQGGTFTITNPGVFGSLFGTPIINQPQVAIMGVGAIVKRPMVVTTADGSDSLAIRSMCYLNMSFDHRLVDGAIADQFLGHVKRMLESASFPELA